MSGIEAPRIEQEPREETCPVCYGSGTIMKDGKEQKCPRCDGKGMVIGR